MGCEWNMPASYSSGKFESCKADNDLPTGVYGRHIHLVSRLPIGPFKSTLLKHCSCRHQGTKPKPFAHPVAKSSSCTSFASTTSGPVKRDYSEDRLVKRAHHARATPPPTF